MTIAATIKPEYIVEKSGRRFVLAAGLVDSAHRAFERLSIVSRLIQAGTAENDNCWIVETRVDTDQGTYVQLGDASPRYTSSAMLGVLPRLAETRSVSRALRLAVNAGVLAIFDDPDEDDDARPAQPRPGPPAEHRPAPRGGVNLEAASEPARPLQRAEPTLARAPGPPSAGASSFPPAHATEQQVEAIYHLGESRHHLDRVSVETDCMLRFGGLKPAALDPVQAGRYIKQLQMKELTA